MIAISGIHVYTQYTIHSDSVDYNYTCTYSTITTWTKDGESDAFKNMLEKVWHTCMLHVHENSL